jgi:hypothetical protein
MAAACMATKASQIAQPSAQFTRSLLAATQNVTGPPASGAQPAAPTLPLTAVVVSNEGQQSTFWWFMPKCAF